MPKPTPGPLHVAVVPKHVCAAVNPADELTVVQDGKIVDRWAVAARGAGS
jgi:D-serine deaminase-like pyridoxal phosphate-dependent protein